MILRAGTQMNYWLMKSEPDTYSIDDLKLAKKDCWDGIRNYQARNFMKNMKKGDKAFFYHSSCPQPGIYGTMEIAKTAYPDYTAMDAKSNYFDPKSTEENPRWYMVDVAYKKTLSTPILLSTLKEQTALEDFKLLARGNRLSILPVTLLQWQYIMKLSS